MENWPRFQQELAAVSGEARRVRLADLPDLWSRWLKEERIERAVAFLKPGPPDERVARAVNLLGDLQKPGPGDPERLKGQLAELDLAVVYGHYLIAQSGTVMLLDAHHQARGLYLLATHLLVLSSPGRLRATLAEALRELSQEHGEEASGFLLVTGPSRTADIEKQLVIGAHGPARLTVWLLEE